MIEERDFLQALSNVVENKRIFEKREYKRHIKFYSNALEKKIYIIISGETAGDPNDTNIMKHKLYETGESTGSASAESELSKGSDAPPATAETSSDHKATPQSEEMPRKEPSESEAKVEAIAKVCHQANKAYCESQGDTSQASWEDAPEWQKKSARNGVLFHLANEDAKPEDSHNNWLKEKELDGWKYGTVKDVEKKEHPCFVPYDQLPAAQQKKDALFIAIVHALK